MRMKKSAVKAISLLLAVLLFMSLLSCAAPVGPVSGAGSGSTAAGQSGENSGWSELKLNDPETKAPETEAPKPETEAPKPETEAPKPETEAPKPETEAPKPETEAPKPETEAPKPETEAPEPEPVIDENGVYDDKENVALYLHTYGKLPSNYITKKEAENLGWTGGSLERFAPGKCIGGTYFGNYEGLLPKKKGRSYYECDIGTLGRSSRGAKRIVWSNDGLIYYSGDHYETFELLYGEE